MRRHDVLVASSGTHPEPHHLATGLRARGVQVQFLSSAMFPRDALMGALSQKKVLPQRLRQELARRLLPVGSHTRQNTRSLAALEEVLAWVASRAHPATGRRAVSWRTARFRAGLAQRVRDSTGTLSAVVGQYTSCADAFAVRGDFRRILMYPIAHHDWMRDFLAEEAAANPRWAPYLQGHDIQGFERDLLEAEIELADLILLPSTFAASTFTARGVDPAKLVVSPLGSEDWSPPEDQPGDDRAFVVLFAGQVNQRKGIGYLVEALAAVQDPRVQLVVVGKSSDAMRAEITRAFGRTRFISSMPRENLMRQMAQADILVLPSLAEGFGLVALESMAVGTPAIVSTHTFASDLIRHEVNGWVVPAANRSAITSLVEALAADPDRVRRVGGGAAQVARARTWFQYGLSTADLLLPHIERPR